MITIMGGFRLLTLCEIDRNKSERNINVIKGPEIKSYIHLKLTEKVHVGVGALHFDSKAQEIEKR